MRQHGNASIVDYKEYNVHVDAYLPALGHAFEQEHHRAKEGKVEDEKVKGEGKKGKEKEKEVDKHAKGKDKEEHGKEDKKDKKGDKKKKDKKGKNSWHED